MTEKVKHTKWEVLTMEKKINNLIVKFDAMTADLQDIENRLLNLEKKYQDYENIHGRNYSTLFTKIKDLETQTDTRIKDLETQTDTRGVVRPSDKPYKIKSITDDYIEFTNGAKITYEHDQDCCEYNYADFKQIDDIAKDYEFTGRLLFEKVENAGFRFGDNRTMFYVPCYSEQNGYYSNELTILLDGKLVLKPDVTMIIY